MRAQPATLTPTLSQREREGETTCYLLQLPGRKALIRVCDTLGGPAIRFEGAAGPDAGLIFNLSQAFMHLFQPTGCAQGKGAIDLVACRQTA